MLIACLVSVVSDAPQRSAAFPLRLFFWFVHTFGGLVVMSLETRWQQNLMRRSGRAQQMKRLTEQLCR